jgi:hypothetical protein
MATACPTSVLATRPATSVLATRPATSVLATRPPPREWPTGPQVIADIAAQTDTVFLAFSAGKDSVAAWLTLRGSFRRIIPFYGYVCPGLAFVERSLAYYEEFFQTPIIRVAHPSFYRQLRFGVFQTCERSRIIRRARLAKFNMDGLREDLCQDLGLPVRHWCANGIRAVDNPQRMTTLRKYGPVNRKQQRFQPVWDMRKAELVKLLTDAEVKLPAEYRLMGRSFDGLSFQYLWPIKQQWPDDYARILEWFPMAELEIKRYEFAQRNRGG